MITPIQRLPRYEMLISQALKYTNKNHHDYKELEHALKLVKEVNVKNNESMGTSTLTKRKLVLNELCRGNINLMKSHRKLLAEYEELKYLDYDKQRLKQCFIALFTDCIVVFASHNFLYQIGYYKHISFNELSYAVDITDTESCQNLFVISGRKHKKLTLSAKDPESKEKIILAVNRQITDLTKNIQSKRKFMKDLSGKKHKKAKREMDKNRDKSE
mmetsp:Transcript_40421/g.39990  ORF Transcript_40421/g.39990 Transcript_40421/m.39990 type:complete len:216 (-) Transcript_40421:11-658(-)